MIHSQPIASIIHNGVVDVSKLIFRLLKVRINPNGDMTSLKKVLQVIPPYPSHLFKPSLFQFAVATVSLPQAIWIL